MIRRLGGYTPPDGARIDWDHPLSRGLVFASVCNHSAYPLDLVTGVTGSSSTGVGSVDGSRTNGSSTYFTWTASPQLQTVGTTAAVTVTAGIRNLDTAQTNAYAMMLRDTAVTKEFAFLYGFVSRTYESWGSNGSSGDGYVKRMTLAQLAVDDNSLHILSESTNAAKESKVYFDGRLADSGANLTAMFAPTQIHLGYVPSSNYFTGIFRFVYVHNRQLSPTEQMELKLDPYALLVEEPRRYYSTPGATAFPHHYYAQMRA